MKKIEVGMKFNFEGITWEVIQVGKTESKAQAVTKSEKNRTEIFDNKNIVANRLIESKFDQRLSEIKI